MRTRSCFQSVSRCFFSQQALWQRGQFRAGIGAPRDATIRQELDNRAAHGAAQGLDAISGLEIGRFAQFFQNGGHRVPVEHAGHIMGYGGGGFTAASAGKFRKEVVAKSACDVREGVPVEEEKRRASVAGSQVVEDLAEGCFYEPLFLPLSADCSKAF